MTGGNTGAAQEFEQRIAPLDERIRLAIQIAVVTVAAFFLAHPLVAVLSPNPAEAAHPEAVVVRVGDNGLLSFERALAAIARPAASVPTRPPGPRVAPPSPRAHGIPAVRVGAPVVEAPGVPDVRTGPGSPRTTHAIPAASAAAQSAAGSAARPALTRRDAPAQRQPAPPAPPAPAAPGAATANVTVAPSPAAVASADASVSTPVVSADVAVSAGTGGVDLGVGDVSVGVDLLPGR